MGHYTRLTRSWLETRYARHSPAGVYEAHQPIYGLTSRHSEPDRLIRLARTLRILSVLNRLHFETFLDVGGGEGYVGELVRSLFGAQVWSGDLSAEACKRAHDLYDIEGLAFDSAHLPFADRSVDVVLCSEVVEHVEQPIETLLELQRVAGVALLVTSEEFSPDREHVRHELENRLGLPHAERNFFHTDDLRLVFGSEARLTEQYRGQPPEGEGFPELEPASAADWIRGAIREQGFEHGGVGGSLLALRGDARLVEPRLSEGELEEALLRALPEAPLVRRAPRATPGEGLLRRLACPVCGASLAEEGSRRLVCTGGAHAFAVDEGVPRLYLDDYPERTPEELEAALRAWPTRQPRDLAAILELRARLRLPDASPQLSWNFDVPAHRAAWAPNDELRPRGEASLSFEWTSIGSDPWVLSPLLILPPEGIEKIHVTLRLSNPAFPVDAPEGQLFWLAEGDPDLNESNSVLFQARNDGQLHTYELPVAEHPRFPRGGSALWLRLDPVAGPGEVELQAIHLVPEARP